MARSNQAKQIIAVENPDAPGTVTAIEIPNTEPMNVIETEQQLAEPDAPVRVLVDCQYGAANTLAVLTQAEIMAAVGAGLVDPDPSAVSAVQP